MKRQNKPQPKTHYKPLNIHQIYPIKTLNKIGSTPLIINKELLNETYFDLTYSRRFEAQKKNYTNLYNKKVDPNANSNKVDKNKKVVLAKTKKESQILKNKDYATQKQQAFKSLTLFSEIMKKSETQSSQKQKRHYPINPNPESYRFFTETNNEKKQTYLVSPSRHRKLLYDFEDKIDFNNTSDSRRGSISLKDLKSTGKKTSYILNMFKESYDLGMDSKITMRKPNKNRTRSSFNFA